VSRFDRFFLRFSRRLDAIFLKAVLVLLLVLLISQGLLANSTLRTFVSRIDRLEGDRIEQVSEPEASVPESLPTSGMQGEPMIITLTREGEQPRPDAKVIVDGEVIGDFSQQEVILSVEAGQCIEIDAAGSDNLTVYVSSVSSSVATPTVGYRVVAYGTNELIGYVTPVED